MPGPQSLFEYQPSFIQGSVRRHNITHNDYLGAIYVGDKQ